MLCKLKSKQRINQLLLVFTALVIISTSQTVVAQNHAAPAPAGMELVWSDDFDDTAIDTTKWKVFTGNYGTPRRLQRYSDFPENVRVRNGALILKATLEDGQWYSGMVTTNDDRKPKGIRRSRGNLGWTYGRFEIRAKVPHARGMWPALWMRPVKFTYGEGWPLNGEIDILEYLGPQRNADSPGAPINKLIANAHWQQDGKRKQRKGTFDLGGPKAAAAFVSEWHTYAVEWTPHRLEYFVDGESYHVIKNWTSDTGGIGPFDQNFDIIMNLQVGGWPGDPVPSSAGSQMEIDWVRVYQDSESGSSSSGGGSVGTSNPVQTSNPVASVSDYGCTATPSGNNVVLALSGVRAGSENLVINNEWRASLSGKSRYTVTNIDASDTIEIRLRGNGYDGRSGYAVAKCERAPVATPSEPFNGVCSVKQVGNGIEVNWQNVGNRNVNLRRDGSWLKTIKPPVGKFLDTDVKLNATHFYTARVRIGSPSVVHDLDCGRITYKSTAQHSCNGKPATHVGTEGDDVITGTNGNDVIVGLRGDDKIDALGGDDVICAGDGDDYVEGRDGNDIIYGGRGNDELRGRGGADKISGGAGNDFITGNDSNDILNGETGHDRILGGSGSDVCYNSETYGTCETVSSRSPICRALANINGSVTLSWDPVPNVDQYNVRVLNGDFVSTVNGASFWTGGSSDRRYEVRHHVNGKVVDIECEN